MSENESPLAVERRFFTALLEADPKTLDQVLADDFLLIDVMQGAEIPKAALLAAVESGQVKFLAIEPAEPRVRLYETAAVITGRTRMNGRFAETSFAVSSRYTHVFARQPGGWRMVSAQGTQITPPEGSCKL